MSKTKIYPVIIIFIIILFAAGAACGLYFLESRFPINGQAPQYPTNLETYLKLSGTLLTLVASLITVIVTCLNVLIQVSTSREIENLKPLLTLQYAAYKELNGAAVGMLDALSRLQNQQYQPDVAQKADDEMTKASGTVFFMPEMYKEAWLDFQQTSRYIKESVDEALVEFQNGRKYMVRRTNKEVSNQQEFWEQLYPTIFAKIENLRQKTPH